MQGTYYFLDLDSRALIKRRRFAELPMPDSVIKKIERWGKRDKQNGLLRFCDRNNDPFDWTDEQEPLVNDNAPEPEPATYPDIPAEMPGVVLEANVPAVESPTPPSEEERMAAAIENAGLADEFEEFRFRGRQETANQRHGRDVFVTHNHINVIPAEEGEMAEAAEQEEEEEEVTGEEIPTLADDDSSDDETYIDEDIEDIELSYDESEMDGDSNDSPSERFQETRSGRRVKPPERYRDTINISVGGMHFTVGEMHFTVGATNLTTPIPVRREELKVLGAIMTQLSLKEGLKRFGERGR
jgi:hypothetical protein